MITLSEILSFKRLTVKLLVPFIIIFITTIVSLGWFFIRQRKVTLTKDLEKKAEIQVRNLAVALSDSFSMGEYDKMQEILMAAKNADEDVDYAIVVGMDGRGVASTQTELRNQMLNRNEFESQAVKATDYQLVEQPTHGGFEVRMPTAFQGHQSGVLRIGVSLKRVHTAVIAAIRTFFGVGT